MHRMMKRGLLLSLHPTRYGRVAPLRKFGTATSSSLSFLPRPQPPSCRRISTAVSSAPLLLSFSSSSSATTTTLLSFSKAEHRREQHPALFRYYSRRTDREYRDGILFSTKGRSDGAVSCRDNSSVASSTVYADPPEEVVEELYDDQEENDVSELKRGLQQQPTAAATTASGRIRIAFEQQQPKKRKAESTLLQRPRLAALRQQLRQEDEQDHHLGLNDGSALQRKQTNGGIVEHHSVGTTTKQKHKSTASSSRTPGMKTKTRKKTQQSQQPQTYDEWRALLETLPELPARRGVLTDRYQRFHNYLRLSITERCNLRCTYCMPEEGVPLQPPAHLLQTEELISLATMFTQQLGVTKLRLTGGEPTLRKDVVELVAGLREHCGEHVQQIGMTSNGIPLPKLLPQLFDAGLNSLNVSLDTLHGDKFQTLTRRPESYLQRVWQTLELAHEYAAAASQSSSSRPFKLKLNCVVMRGTNELEIPDFLQLSTRFPYMDIRFIEYMPFTKNGWCGEKFVSYQEMLQIIQESSSSGGGTGLAKLPIDDPHDTTKWYTTTTANGECATTVLNETHLEPHQHHHQPRIGFITSMSSNFCSGCNRIRLTADGQLKVCLFDGQQTVSLRDAIRIGHYSDVEIHRLVHAALQLKHEKLGGHDDPQHIQDDADNNRPMTLIGG